MGHNNIEPFAQQQQEADTKSKGIDFSKFDYEDFDCHDHGECLESWQRRIDHDIFMDVFRRDPFVCTQPTKSKVSQSKDDEIERKDDSYNHREDIPWDAPRVREIMNDDEILALLD